MNICIIGAGWSGLTAAYLLKRKGHFVTVIEKRAHIGGNAYDEVDESKLIIPKYGAHIFHTYNKQVWDFVNQFSSFNNYVHHVKVRWGYVLYDYPITAKIDEAECAKWQDRAAENFETACLAKMGERLYEIFVKPYTRKMWGREPHTLSAKLAARVPIRPNGEKQMFLDPYQGMPTNGYHTLFNNMADGLFILHDDYHALNLPKFDHLIVTSPIDEWYGYDLGKLEYRGMRFETMCYQEQSCIMDVGTINRNDDPHILRMEEPKRYYQQENNHTIIVYNYADGDSQYYPVPDAANDELAEKYRMRAASETSITFLGRLGQYRYLNQDQAILMAMQVAERIGDA